MAEMKSTSVSDMTSLARALSSSGSHERDQNDEFHSQTNFGRGSVPHLGRKRKLMGCGNAVHSCEEVCVLVINTGGTIGMTLKDGGKWSLNTRTVPLAITASYGLLPML